MRIIPTLLALSLALAPAALPAQSAPPADACAALRAAVDSALSDSASAKPDVVVRASATIAELRFDAQPGAHVSFPACAPGDSLRVLERRNLPSPVQPGVTYRDVRVSVEIRASLASACAAALTSAVCPAPAQPPAPAPPAAPPPPAARPR